MKRQRDMKEQVLGALVVALLLPPEAHGQATGDAAASIRRHHRLAREHCDIADYAGARAQLRAALEEAEAVNLEPHPLTARTHVMLGATYILGAGDRAKAIEHFKIALEMDPDVDVPAPLDTEQVKAALARADAELHPRVSCESLRGIDHNQVTRAHAGRAVEVVFKAGPELRSGTAHLSFRPQEAPDFVEVPMSPRGECEYVGQIPADAVRGEVMHYFVSIRKDDGRYLAMRGTPESPYTIVVLEAASAPPGAASETEAEIPDGLVSSTPPRGAGCAGCAAGSENTGTWSLVFLLLGALVLGRRAPQRPGGTGHEALPSGELSRPARIRPAS